MRYTITKQDAEKLGRWITAGALDRIATTALAMILTWVILTFLLSLFLPRDDSDPAKGRSGFQIRADALTGCEYLETRKGAITPRLDATGRQVCR